jgi:hypothetical protein
MIEQALISKRIADDTEKSVLRIRNVHPRSRVLTFFHPGSWFLDPESNNNNKRGGGKLFGLTFF